MAIVFANAGYLGVCLLLWRLPAIIADTAPLASHFIPGRLALVFVLNTAIPLVTNLAEGQAVQFILSSPFRMKLIMDLTVTTAVFSAIALFAYAYDSRHRLDGLIRTAKALPWPDHPDPLQHMTEFASATLRVDRVEIRSTPPRSRFEIGTPFRTHSGDTRYLVALRNPGRSPLLDRDLQTLSAIAHIGQETMRVRGEANELRTEANTDPLTGLFNYRGFQAAIDDVNSRRTERGAVALVYIDLDGFKGINDHYGHEAGNKVLIEVSHRLQEAVRPRDTVARVGGDEFVILLRDIKDRGHAQHVAQRIIASASSPVLLGQTLLQVRLSEGVAFSDDQHEDLVSLVNEADALMYAKRGRQLSTDAEIAAGGAVAGDHPSGRRGAIADIINHGLLRVEYQPIVDGVKGTVVALEALVRGTHPTYGTIDPSVLVHEAKRLRLLDLLTEQVLDLTFADMARIQQVAPGLQDVHVNLELGQLSHGPVGDQLRRLCAAHPEVRLTVEMTENSLTLADEEVLATLGGLREAGIRLALDDFGQGYSTMLAIVEFPFDALKIDRSLITSVTTSAKSVQVIRSLARLCRNLRVTMIVEGVELAEERDVLLRLGAKHMQGFLFSRPETVGRLCERFAARGLTVGNG
jgi:diguanylate cyclase (GGDEF)-like protein